MPVAEHPLDNFERAALLHPALAWGDNAQALRGVRVADACRWKPPLLLGLASVLLLAFFGSLAATESQTLKGEYLWSASGEGGSLEAVFTPDGEEKWNVDFHFTFAGEPRVYSGTAQGSLTGGELRGEVSDDRRGRTFSFRMKFEDGRLRGTHAEITGGREQPTGTLSLG